MSRTVTALYDTRAEADRALLALREEVSLAHGEVYDCAPGNASRLDDLDLTPEERASCERTMESGDHMLLAQVRSGENPDHIIEVLERIAGGHAGGSDFSGEHDQFDSSINGRSNFGGQSGHGDSSMHGDTIAEERLPVVEEELRVGTQEVVRGGARVRTRVEELPVVQDVELLEEHTNIERRPASRLVSEAELEQGGLLRERVIEVAQIREEAVVTKEAFVREEVIVKKTVERRVEQIHDTVRRTEVETDDLRGGAERPALSGLDQDRSDFSR